MAKVGDIVVKLSGSEAGRKGVVVEIAEPMALVTGPPALSRVRRRSANLRHLRPTGKSISLPSSASDEDVVKALEAAGLLEFMREREELPPKRHRLGQDSESEWEEARRLCRLTSETEAMARELGFSPRALIKNRPSPSQQWKADVNDWIRELHARRRVRSE